MTNRLLMLTAVSVLAIGGEARPLLAQAAPPPAAAAPAKDVDPVGTYQLSVAVQGNAMAAGVKIEKAADGSMRGTVSTEAYGSFTINAVKVSGKTVTISITASDGNPVTITLELEGDQVTGEWSMYNDGSKVSGKKLP